VSAKAPHFSLDLIGAFLENFQTYTPQQKEQGLLYLQPWIAPMETQLRSNASDFLDNVKEIKSVLRAFIRLTYEKPEVRLKIPFSDILVNMVHEYMASRRKGHRISPLSRRRAVSPCC
jgi:hypothetical protein